MTLKVSLDALSSDAARWSTASQTLVGAGQVAGGLGLSDDQLSWAGQDTGLVATYEQLRVKVEALLAQGASETDEVAATLRGVRRVYESTDEDAKQRLKGSWDAAG